MDKRQLFTEIMRAGRFPEDITGKICSSTLGFSIDINNKCNLHCKHCYWGITKLKQKELSVDEIKRLIDDSITLGATSFAFAGKEPFFSDKIIEVLAHLKSRKQDACITYGVVSNGTLIAAYLPVLKQFNIDYIDISIDGIREVHDKIRREGAYDAATAALRQIIDSNVVKKAFVSMCYNKANSGTFFDAIADLAEKGVRNFCVIPYLHSERSSDELTITFDEFFGFLRQLEHHSPKEPVEIMVDLEWYMVPLVRMLLEDGEIDIKDVKEDALGNLYTQLENRCCRIYLKFGFADLNRFVVTADGYFGNIYMKSNNNYHQTATGNVREKDILEMSPRAINDAVQFYNKNLERMGKEITIASHL